MSIWDSHPELTEKLEVLARDGLSTAQIARELGHGLTRNAVGSKMNRVSIAKRFCKPASVTKQRPMILPSHGGSKPKLRTAPIKIVPDEDAPQPMTDESGEPITALNAKDTHCRAVYGDVADGSYRYCGHTAENGSFCKFHRSRFYTPATAHRRQNP